MSVGQALEPPHRQRDSNGLICAMCMVHIAEKGQLRLTILMLCVFNFPITEEEGMHGCLPASQRCDQAPVQRGSLKVRQGSTVNMYPLSFCNC